MNNSIPCAGGLVFACFDVVDNDGVVIASAVPVEEVDTAVQAGVDHIAAERSNSYSTAQSFTLVHRFQWRALNDGESLPAVEAPIKASLTPPTGEPVDTQLGDFSA